MPGPQVGHSCLQTEPLVLQGTELQDENELEDDGDYEENGRGAEEDDVDGEPVLLYGVPAWREIIRPSVSAMSIACNSTLTVGWIALEPPAHYSPQFDHLQWTG